MTRKEVYKQYLKSDEWKELRALAIEDTPYCVLCSSEERLQVHHRKYPTRLGDEPLAWLTVLCAKCHCKHHGKKDRKPKRKKKKKLKSKGGRGGHVKVFNKEEIEKYQSEKR